MNKTKEKQKNKPTEKLKNKTMGEKQKNKAERK